jgi:membrane protein YqaA with SNARE-associated domain
MDSAPEKAYAVMTPKTYVFGGIIFLLSALGIYMLMVWPRSFPLQTLFFYNIASNAAIAILPHEPVVIWYGKFLNLWHITIAATLGTLVAAYLDYRFFVPLLNLSYSAKYKSSRVYRRWSRWFHKLPFLVLVLAGFLPVPFYPFKFMALSAKYPMPKYLASVTVGRFPRYYLLGLAGFALQIPNWIIIMLFIAILLAVYYRKAWNVLSGWFTAMFGNNSSPG